MLKVVKTPVTSGVGRGARDQLLHSALESDKTPPAAVLHLHPETAALSDARNRRRQDGDRERFLDAEQPFLDFADYRCGVLVLPGPFLERCEDDEDGAGVRGGTEGSAGEAGDADGVGDPRNGAGRLGRSLHHRVGALERGALGQLDRDDRVALVRLRDEAARHGPERVNGRREQSGIDEQEHCPVADDPADGPAVAVRHAVEAAVEPVPKPPADTAPAMIVVRLQEDRRESG